MGTNIKGTRLATYNLGSGGTSLEFEVPDGVFQPTKTSNFLISHVAKHVQRSSSTLDIGCGCGYVGVVLAKMGLVAGPLHASDRSFAAVESCRRNAAQHGVDCDARAGSLFDPWLGEKFELIVDDVSGVAEKIGEMSSWFPGASHCGAGVDGTELTTHILDSSRDHLTTDGSMFFPVLSLSRTEKIVAKAHEMFETVELLGDQYFPVSPEVGSNMDLLRGMAQEGLISIRQIGGKWVWWTSIYLARNAR